MLRMTVYLYRAVAHYLHYLMVICLLDQIPWNTKCCSEFVIPYTESKKCDTVPH